MEAEGRRSWRSHPLVRRLPFLLLAALGLWLFRASDAPERELVWRLEGPGWSQVRSLEFQLKDSEGELLKREERFFQAGPPESLTLKAELPSGAYQVWVFGRTEGGPLEPRVERLTLGDDDVRVERGLRRPSSR